MVDEELRRQAKESDENQEGISALLSSDVSVGPTPAQRVTADGTYITQTALTSSEFSISEFEWIGYGHDTIRKTSREEQMFSKIPTQALTPCKTIIIRK